MSDGDKTTVVETRSGGTVVLAIVGLIVVVLLAWFLFGSGMMNSGTQKIDADVKIDTPAKP